METALVEMKSAFPTCVGMNRQPRITQCATARVPYMCGDEPSIDFPPAPDPKRSLHVWG